MAKAIISIGSSMGHRRSMLERAVARVVELVSPEFVKCSSVIETEAWGYKSDAQYLNMCLSFETGMSPEALLQNLLEIQRSIDSSPHRDQEGNYIDRPIDIDLIAVDLERRNTDSLQLPHPKAHLRAFVTVPFMEIEPELCFRVCCLLTDNT